MRRCIPIGNVHSHNHPGTARTVEILAATRSLRSLAFSRALFDRAAAGELAVIEAFAATATKTKAVNQVVGRIAPAGKVLLVDAPFAADTRRAARNIERVARRILALLAAAPRALAEAPGPVASGCQKDRRFARGCVTGRGPRARGATCARKWEWDADEDSSRSHLGTYLLIRSRRAEL